jgi:ribonuclease G
VLLVSAGFGETRIALVVDGRLADYQVARDSEVSLLGNLYLGRVTRVMPAMQAAFVEIGTSRAGFLSLREARHLSTRPEPGISDCVREGEALAVMVIREAEGDKGPRLTANVARTPELETRCRMARPPARLATAPSLLERVLRDLPQGVTRIAIDDARTAQAMRAACPDLEARMETVHQAFDDALEEDIARLSAPRITLPGGGWITIEATEGFTAIDVNSGGYAASGGREETALAVNLEAAQEVARQIRLRAIGGLVVADFIQMEEIAATRLVESVLTKGLAPVMGEAVPTDITLSRTGLAVITRKRARPPLSRFTESCVHCDGSSVQPTAESVALSALRAAERSARAAPGRPVTLRVAPEVFAWIRDHDSGLAPRGLGGLKLEPGPGPREAFDVTTG